MIFSSYPILSFLSFPLSHIFFFSGEKTVARASPHWCEGIWTEIPLSEGEADKCGLLQTTLSNTVVGKRQKWTSKLKKGWRAASSLRRWLHVGLAGQWQWADWGAKVAQSTPRNAILGLESSFFSYWKSLFESASHHRDSQCFTRGLKQSWVTASNILF